MNKNTNELLNEYIEKEISIIPAPKGLYGVYYEARGHLGNPGWLAKEPMFYEQAIIEADYMNRANQMWHYYAKPVPAK